MGGCWTLLDNLLDAPEPQVAAGEAEKSAESARRAASVCRQSWRAVVVATWERCWRGLGADPGDQPLVMDTPDARVTHVT